MTRSPMPRVSNGRRGLPILFASAIVTVALCSHADAQLAASNAPAPKPTDTLERATWILLGQVALSRSQHHQGQAADRLARVLAFDPTNADALAMREQLQADHPAEPRIGGKPRMDEVAPTPTGEARVSLGLAETVVQSGQAQPVSLAALEANTIQLRAGSGYLPKLASNARHAAWVDIAPERRGAVQPSPAKQRGRSRTTSNRLCAAPRAGLRNRLLALAAAKMPAASQRLGYADALVAAGYGSDARTVLEPVDPVSLAADDRLRYDQLQNAIAIQQSDRLNQMGDQASAYDALSPRLEAQPGAPDLNMALGRLYQSSRRPREALRIDEALLSQNSADLDIRGAAVSAAAQAGEFQRAGAMVMEAMHTAPHDPRTYVMSAGLAQARGDGGRALSDLRRARALHMQQTGATQDEDCVVGAGGIEPPNGGIKIRCLTAWRRPSAHAE